MMMPVEDTRAADYEKQQVNPLVVAILQVLKRSDKPLGIHHLLQEIKAISKIPALDDDEQLGLFKLNWLMMNALYQLQQALLPSGYYLQIATLEIFLGPVITGDAESAAVELRAQPLRDYYLDWKNFSDTTVEQIQAMLDGVWQEYLSPDQQHEAYSVLGVDVTASWVQVKKAYRQMAARHHPDKGGDAQRFMAVRQAYECLKQSLNG